jgi:hypothetical protein
MGTQLATGTGPESPMKVMPQPQEETAVTVFGFSTFACPQHSSEVWRANECLMKAC